MGKREYLMKAHEGVARTRREHGITIDAISSGLCSGSQVSLWENGNATLDFAIRYRIYSRLFIEDSIEEWMIDNAEYQVWRRQNNIVWLLCMERYDEAKTAIEEYLNEPDLKPLERQFVLRMKAIYLMATGGKREEIYKYTKEAFDITVPDFSWDNLRDRILSSEELDMLLDIERYSDNDRKKIGAVIGYLVIREIKEPYQRKIITKATYYYLDTVDIDNNASLKDLFMLKEKTEYALENLRNTGHCNYMWELFLKKFLILKRIITLMPEREELLKDELKKAEDYIKTMENVHKRVGVRPDTVILPDTYIPCHVNNLSEIIYKRRRMVGISQNNLCKDICDIKTIRRWQQGKSVPQEYVKSAVLNRLGLESNGFMYEEVQLFEFNGGMLDYIADHQEIWLEKRCLLSYIYNLYGEDELTEDTVDSDYYMFGGDYRDYRDRRLEELKQTLEAKFPIDIIITAEDRWFSQREIFDYCRYISMYNGNPEKRKEYIEAIKSYFDEMLNTDMELSECTIIERVYGEICSEYGNEGRFDESNKLSDYLLKGQLCFRRFNRVGQLLYNNWWNYNELLAKTGMKQAEDMKKRLKECINAAELVKDDKIIAFLKNKMELMGK